MRMYDIIKYKRDGRRLSDECIDFAISGFSEGEIPDYQMSALAMAIWFNGMDEKETASLTLAMMNSGEIADLSELGSKTVDKHSTGGVGDKTSIAVLPIVAACGAVCAKMSGRGLGHTGGTVDKLESLPGYRTEMSRDEFMAQVKEIGIALVGQSGNFAPADKKLYALRDVSATVDSIPLIASSIMSKKLASGAHSIVLDVKVGSGAFMKTEEEARQLALCMTSIGRSLGRNVRAVITGMDEPLGYTVGNSLELAEAVEILKGAGPEDLKQVCTELAINMLVLSLGISRQNAQKAVCDAIDSGRAFDKLCRWVKAQGGDTRFLNDTSLLPLAENVIDVYADRSGYITHMDAERIGSCACMLGAGRTVKDAPIDHGAGIILYAKTGDRVSAGDRVARFYTGISDADQIRAGFLSALSFGECAPQPLPLIIDTI